MPLLVNIVLEGLKVLGENNATILNNEYNKIKKNCYYFWTLLRLGFPDSSVSKESACKAGESGSIPGSIAGEGTGYPLTPVFLGFPCGSANKESACNAGELGLIHGLGRSPGEVKGYPLPVFWPGEFHELYSTWGGSQRVRED